MTRDEMLQEQIRILENEDAHHADRESAAWLNYQACHDALGIKLPEIINAAGGIWNDHTQKWEHTQESRATKADGVVQRRIRLAEFSRELGAYSAVVQRSDPTRGLPGGVHNPTPDHPAGVRTEHGSDDPERDGSDLRGDEGQPDDAAEPAG